MFKENNIISIIGIIVEIITIILSIYSLREQRNSSLQITYNIVNNSPSSNDDEYKLINENNKTKLVLLYYILLISTLVIFFASTYVNHSAIIALPNDNFIKPLGYFANTLPFGLKSIFDIGIYTVFITSIFAICKNIIIRTRHNQFLNLIFYIFLLGESAILFSYHSKIDYYKYLFPQEIASTNSAVYNFLIAESPVFIVLNVVVVAFEIFFICKSIFIIELPTNYLSEKIKRICTKLFILIAIYLLILYWANIL